MLQAFRLDDTCRCVTTSTSITQSRNYTRGTSTVWVVGTCRHSSTGTSILGMIWTTSAKTIHNPLLDLRDLVVHNVFNSAPLSRSCDRSRNFTGLLYDSGTIFVDILYIHAGNLHNGFRNHNCGFSTSCSECSTMGHFHDLFTWLKLYLKHLFRDCLHLRLTVWTQSPKIIILALM